MRALERRLVGRQIVLTELRRLRELRGVTQGEIAMRMGVKQSAISKLECRSDPRAPDLCAYVGALGGELTLSARFADAEFALRCFDEGPPPSR